MSSTSPLSVGVDTPLTEAQAGLWYAQRLDAANPVFNTGQYLELTGRLDAAAFARAVDGAMVEADGLQVALFDRPDGPRQRLAAHPLRLEIVDCQAAPDPYTAAMVAIDRDMTTPLDLARDPLARQQLFVLGPERHVWYQRVHHAVIDGYGTSLLTRRICDVYAASLAGRAPSTRPFLPYQRLLDEEAAYQQSAERQRDRDYWRQRFAEAPEVVGLAEGTALTAHTYRRRSHAVDAETARHLIEAADAAGVPWADVLVALAGAYVQRHTARTESTVGVPAMLRVGSAAARIPAMVMNVLPVRVPDGDAQPLSAFLQAVGAELKGARRHGRYRSEQLRRDLGLLAEGRRLHGPLINILPFDTVPALPGLETRLEVLGTGPVDDLTITFRADAAGQTLRLELDANPQLYDDAAVDAHIVRLAAFLRRAVASATLADVPTATPEETQRYIVDVNRTGHPVEAVTLTALIERSMAERPAAPALSFAGGVLSYAELDARTRKLAGRLAAFGAGRNRVVAVSIPRSLELTTALVGVLRAGAAYLPLDVDTPPERLRTILGSAQPAVILTTTALVGRFAGDTPVLALDRFDWTPEPGDGTPDATTLDDAAYVIYTSGSTGVPKGVVVEHRAIVNRIEWMRVHYGVSPDDRILQKTPPTFDVSVWEFFLPLVAGGTLVMAPPDAHKDPAWLARLIREERITTLHFVPSMLAQFLAEPAARGLRIARVFCSGEALTAAIRDRFHQVVEAELHNLYGPTEAAVDVTYWDAGRHDRGRTVPIGFPVWNTRMYVLDGRRRPLPDGVPGGLYIAGVQLAREYLGRPDLTADRFVPDPYAAPGERMYDTGDVARWRSDGAIEYLGRSDHQVKIRGQRIELGEIEAALLAQGVAQAAVVSQPHRGEHRLVAYLQPHPGVSLDLDAIQEALRERLPAAMLPAAFVVLESFPLTGSGKLDRARLPVPAEAAAGDAMRPPRSATERRVARIFAEALGLDPHQLTGIGLDSDFFALGGHSLLATQVMRSIRDAWPCELGLGVLFTNPTVGALAAVVDATTMSTAPRSLAEEGLDVLVRLADGAGPPLFCVHPAGGIAWCYGALARSLAPAREVYGVQATALDLTTEQPLSLDGMAEDYVNAIRRVQPTGAVRLLGWSVGGIIAHAMAATLERRGETVGLLAMLDSYPSDRWRDQAPPEEAAAWNALLLIAGVPGDEEGPLTREGALAALRRSGHPLGSLPDAVLDGVLRVVAHNSGLVRSHRHQRVQTAIVHFRAGLDHADTDLSPADWRPYTAAGVTVHQIPARHPEMVGADASRQIARLLQQQEGW